MAVLARNDAMLATAAEQFPAVSQTLGLRRKRHGESSAERCQVLYRLPCGTQIKGVDFAAYSRLQQRSASIMYCGAKGLQAATRVRLFIGNKDTSSSAAYRYDGYIIRDPLD